MKNDSNSAWNKRGIALNPQSLIHFIDHLAVVSILMDIPYLFLDDQHYHQAMRLYPGLKGLNEEYLDFSPEYLFEHFDVSFLSDLWDRNTMHNTLAPFEEKYNKTWRNVHCPHGFSDKGFYLSKSAMEDVVLIYGDNMIDQIKAHGRFEDINQYVITGNYRYNYYLQHVDFYQKIYNEDIQSHFDKKRPLILYAPTWVDFESSSSFFDAYSYILDALPDDYNMIVKLHPRLELDDVVNYHRIIGQYEEKNNVLFLSDFPPVFPLLANTDIYLGDMSSVGYDFLAFDKPLFLLNTQNRDPSSDRGLLLYHCATEVKPSQFESLYPLIEKTLPHEKDLYSEKRKQMWQYTFGKMRPFEEIKADIIKACS